MKTLVPFLLLIFFSTAHAGDVCDIRPDLCGSGAPKKKHKASGRQEIMKAAEDIEDDIETEFYGKSHAPRRPASRAQLYREAPSTISYESYLQLNSAHPAIARRPANMQGNQTAFVQTPVKSTITGSTLEQPATNQGAVPNLRLMGQWKRHAHFRSGLKLPFR